MTEGGCEEVSGIRTRNGRSLNDPCYLLGNLHVVRCRGRGEGLKERDGVVKISYPKGGWQYLSPSAAVENSPATFESPQPPGRVRHSATAELDAGAPAYGLKRWRRMASMEVNGKKKLGSYNSQGFPPNSHAPPTTGEAASC